MKHASGDIQRFEKLVSEFQQLSPLRETPKTLLQISGFPHWEIVCSNILAFFFDQRAEHGLDNVFLKSLLEVYDSEFGSSFANMGWSIEDKPVREEETEDGKQLDLMIIARPLLVGIENKIHAQANYNPFEIYSKHLKQRADEEGIDQKHVVKILLALNKETAGEKGGFRPIIYEKFLRQIRNNLGHHVLKCDQRYLTFLVDFMNTIKNEQKETEMDHELCEFLKDGREVASVQFFTRLKKFQKLLRSRIKRVEEKVSVPSDFTLERYHSLAGDGSDEKLYDSLNFTRELRDGTEITACAWIGPDGWKVEAYTKPEKLGEWLKPGAIPQTQEYGFDDSEDRVAAACTKLLKAISKLP